MTNDAQPTDQSGSAAATLDPTEHAREAASTAYRNLVRHVDDLALVVLHPAEATTLRDAADACLFDDADAVGRVSAACELLARLSEFGRLEAHAVARLSDELVAVDCESRRLAARAA
jgi:hypothetical protein